MGNKVKVGVSKLHGKGIFANRNIRKSEIILDIDDSCVVEDPSKLTQKQLDYKCDFLPDKIVMMQPPEVYINHSCDPNTFVKTVKGVRKVIALKNISKGEEITYDYVINSDNDGFFECHCGSLRCRGAYKGRFFELPSAIQIKYLPYLEEWFIKQHKKEIRGLLK